MCVSLFLLWNFHYSSTFFQCFALPPEPCLGLLTGKLSSAIAALQQGSQLLYFLCIFLNMCLSSFWISFKQNPVDYLVENVQTHFSFSSGSASLECS